ncbi:MAG: hypothetical protein KGD64_01490 [Candidatus Heimdallarchaeota archaeon]|nr:hypothetical protein [Candidatus Heimdallarchaeota archaeon]
MKPPVCVICSRRFSPQEEGGVVNFAKRKGDIEWEKKDIVEHPPYADWFCGRHFSYAENLSGLTINKAMEKIIERFASDYKQFEDADSY